MKISQNTKTEIKSIVQTFLAVFIPMAVYTIQTTEFSNLSKESIIAISTALLRSAIKAGWEIIASKYLTK